MYEFASLDAIAASEILRGTQQTAAVVAMMSCERDALHDLSCGSKWRAAQAGMPVLTTAHSRRCL
ncbi:hypothetical protein AS156_39260 [Bradyrhizobium macuxiense]|uniref:Uncharacterized protein n=1 Tax=Bradyrhizobium macuxiense TaxID=1755647 RepID=A0A109JYB3_9BRAD|nr:hypothetical protein AS156_39260 [Bradyrhizobium macuxiense]